MAERRGRGQPRNEAAYRAAARYRLTPEVAAKMLREGRLPREAGEPGEPYLTVDEVAARVDRTPTTVRRWIRGGLLPATKLARSTVRVAESDLVSFVDAERSSGEQRPSL